MSQLKAFLIHSDIKRKQADQMERLIKECDGKSVVIQVDFSDNAIF